MLTIHLEQLRFKAFHGIMEQEKILGNEYQVDCAINFYEEGEVIQHIDNTINYVDVYEIIKNRMSVPTPLLETVIMETGLEIFENFPDIKSIDISLKKLHPPIENFQGTVGVSWHKEF